MRSIVLALAFAAPLSAVAATPNTFTRPSHTHEAKPTMVYVTFLNNSSMDREVLIGDNMYKLLYTKSLHIALPAGTLVRVYSEHDSKVNGQNPIEITEANQNGTIHL